MNDVRVIAVTNQKGGVGKTTTAVNLAAALAEAGRRVLMVDLDPQGNATMGSGVDKDSLRVSVCDVLLGDAPIEETVVTGLDARFDLIPSNADLTLAEVTLKDLPHFESRLRESLRSIEGQYDYILIDCPPSLNVLTLNALVAASYVFVPMQCEYYALEGLTDLLETIEGVRANLNNSLAITGLVRTMYDPRNNLATDVSAQLIAHFGTRVYNTVIPRNVRLAEAPSYGMPVLLYDRSSRGALAYIALAQEMMARFEVAEQGGTNAAGAANGNPEDVVSPPLRHGVG